MGLFLNAERVRLWDASAMAEGVRAAFSKGRLPRAWYDAVTPLAEAVDEAMRQGNNTREEARVLGRK